MAIYIKGVDMPKDCNSCPMRVHEVLDCCSVVSFSVEDYLDRPPFCPLTEVAEPHGRLIDIDALIDQISIDSAGNRGQYGDEWLFEDTIEKAPTIIERSENEDI